MRFAHDLLDARALLGTRRGARVPRHDVPRQGSARDPRTDSRDIRSVKGAVRGRLRRGARGHDCAAFCDHSPAREATTWSL
eukprot:1950118-Pleurochrysis_carterae.AAC.2